MKIKLTLTLYLISALLQSLFYLEIAIEIRQVHKRFIKLPATLLFWHNVLYKFLYCIFSKVIAFKAYFVSG